LWGFLILEAENKNLKKNHEKPFVIHNPATQMLGEGCFGKVFNVDGIAIKYFEISKELPIDVIRECNALTTLNNHEGFVKLLDVNLTISKYSISLSLYDINLSNHIISTKVETRSTGINIILSQLYDSLKILENHNLSHNDIKPDNILLKKEEDRTIYCLCDFGACVDNRVYYGYSSDRNDLGLVMLCYLSDDNNINTKDFLERKSPNKTIFSDFHKELSLCNTDEATRILELLNFTPIQPIINLPIVEYPSFFRKIMEKIEFHEMVYANAFIMYTKIGREDICSVISYIYISMSLIEDFEVVCDLSDLINITEESINIDELYNTLILTFEEIGKRGILI
jgi:serine/threonine protein kinase